MELPLGFGMALAQDEAAMERFEALSGKEKRDVLQRARGVRSKQEMRRLVAGVGGGDPEPVIPGSDSSTGTASR